MSIHDDGYLLIPNFLENNISSKFSKILFDLYKKSEYIQDQQCKISQSFYGLPDFDDFLQKTKYFISDVVNTSIVPTYSYARIYRKGEQLKKHTDRRECEFSVTITLDYSGKSPWPFYLLSNGKEVEIQIEKGSMLIYKGNELSHWRNTLTHDWQTQLFLHYMKYDGKNLRNKDRLLSMAIKGGLVK